MKKKKLQESLYKMQRILLELQFDYESAEDKSEVEHLIGPMQDLEKYIADLRSKIAGVNS